MFKTAFTVKNVFRDCAEVIAMLPLEYLYSVTKNVSNPISDYY